MISVHIHLKILYVLWTLLCLVFTHNVQLLDNSQKDSNTKCTSGLLLDVDQIGFKCVVSFEKDNDTLPFVTFVIKEEFDPRYNHLLTLGLLSECVTGHNIADSVVNCKKINDTEFHITVLTKALSKYSGARVMGYFDTYDPDGTSVQLPQSYEPTAAFGTLSINGQIKSSDMFCNETIDKEELNLKFNCSSSAEPCVGEIYVDDSFVGTPIENGALYNGKVQNGEEVTVTIKYAACRLDGKYNTMTCRINASYLEKGDHHDTTTTSTDKTSTGTDKTSTGTTPIIGIVVGVAGGILTLIVGIGVVYKFTDCFGFIKPEPVIDIEKENSNKTDPEIASADTKLLKTGQNDDDKTTNVSDTTKDKVTPTDD